MFPANLVAVMQQVNDAEVERNLEAARHRAAHAAARRGRSRARFARVLQRNPYLRTESQTKMSPV
jgi:hypothetical protein